MKLESFQIQNCFGFRNSGKVTLSDVNNFLYILGRNSSGKSSLLNSIKNFEREVIPNKHPNFYNFNDSGEYRRLIAEFSIEASDLSLDRFIADFYGKYASHGINPDVIKSTVKLKALVETLSKLYQTLINKIISDKKARIEKTETGSYLFAQYHPYEEYNSRMKAVGAAIDAAREADNKFIITGTRRSISMSFHEIEDIMILQFPRIFHFTERFSLNESLPERIISETITSPGNNLTKAFINYLDSKLISRFLSSNDYEEREELNVKLQERVNNLTAKVNMHRSEDRNKDLLEIKLHEKAGLQITVLTDGKKSYFSHLSDNTKFLFAYFLYHERENISGDVLLFDEPTNGFHPTAQEYILNFLKTLASNDNLVIVATHSEYLIDLNLLSGVRLMSVDERRNISVKNHIYNQPTEKGDYLALQPVFDAIGYNYGRQINVRDKVIITEGITDMLYLRAFNIILKHEGELHIAPSRGDSLILSLIPFLISQGLSFKIVLDKSNIKDLIQKSYAIDDTFIFEIQIPAAYVGRMTGSGIEDLFTKEDFKKLLVEAGETIEANYEHVSNSHYMRDKPTKRIVAHRLYEKAMTLDGSAFEPETIDNFRRVLDFCKAENWFSI